MFKNVPKKIVKTLMLLKALDIPSTFKLLQEVMYLWREYYIKTEIKPVIKEFVIQFSYKDNNLLSFKTEDLKDLIKIIQDIKLSRGEKVK